jgi:hypothetical protein
MCVTFTNVKISNSIFFLKPILHFIIWSNFTFDIFQLSEKKLTPYHHSCIYSLLLLIEHIHYCLCQTFNCYYIRIFFFFYLNFRGAVFTNITKHLLIILYIQIKIEIKLFHKPLLFENQKKIKNKTKITETGFCGHTFVLLLLIQH